MDKKTIIMLTLSIIPFIHCYSQTKEIEGCYIIRYEKNEIWHDRNVIPIDYTEVREFIPYFKCEGIPEILEGQITTYIGIICEGNYIESKALFSIFKIVRHIFIK